VTPSEHRHTQLLLWHWLVSLPVCAVQSVQVAPQCIASEVVSGLAQLPSGQGAEPSAQLHWLLVQVPAGQIVPQDPQLLGSLVRSVSHMPSPLQSSVPLPHCEVQEEAF
jgi:hypothetical protein